MSSHIKIPKSKLSFAIAAATAGLASQANATVPTCEDITVTVGTDDTTTAPAGSLREAVETINSTGDCGDFHTISFDSGVSTVELDGKLDIYADTDIQGPGIDGLTITTSSTGSNVKFNADAADLKLSNFTFDDIRSVFVENGANLELDNMVVKNFESRAINTSNQYSYDNSVTISNSLITGNVDGGLRIDNSDLYITDSVISNNGTYASSGGGIRFSSSQSGSSFTMSGSSVDGNSAYGQGGGLYFYANNPDTISIESSAFTNNEVTNQYAYGAGLHLRHYGSADAVISNTTISGNTHSNPSARGSGGGIYSRGFNSGNLDINASTIVQNSAYSGSGIYNSSSSATINLDGTVLADNDGDNGYVYLNNVSNSYIGDDSGITISGTETNSTVDGDDSQIGLGALAANGGLGMSHMPEANSPLVNAGASSSTLSTDQLGNTRVVSGKMDIGAVERSGSPNAAKPWNGNPSSGSSSFSFLALLGSLIIFRRKLK